MTSPRVSHQDNKTLNQGFLLMLGWCSFHFTNDKIKTNCSEIIQSWNFYFKLYNKDLIWLVSAKGRIIPFNTLLICKVHLNFGEFEFSGINESVKFWFILLLILKVYLLNFFCTHVSLWQYNLTHYGPYLLNFRKEKVWDYTISLWREPRKAVLNLKTTPQA